MAAIAMPSSAPPPKSAQVMVFHAVGQPHELRTILLPTTAELNDGEMIVRVSLASVCGSDLHTVSGHRKEPLPCVLGHEGVGTVVQSQRPDFQLNTRVTWSVADSCGTCDRCVGADLPQKCRNLFKYGHALASDGSGLNGCYASHILLRAGTHVVKVPDGVSDTAAVAANCALATVCNVFEQIARFFKWEDGTAVTARAKRYWIQGAGLLGLYLCALLNEDNPDNVVFVSDISDERLALVKSFGGTPVLARDVDTAIDSGSVDCVVEASGFVAVVKQGIAKVRPGALYFLVGVVHPDSHLAEVTGEQIIRNCLTLVGVHNYAPRHLTHAINFLGRNSSNSKFPFDQLCSPEPLPLVELDQCIELARSRSFHRYTIKP